MKKKLIIIIAITLILSIGTYIFLSKETEAKIFKEEYEAYNEKYIKLNIDKKNPIKYLNDETIIKNFQGKDKVIYIASPQDNNSRKATKILLDLAKENGIEEIYYYNPDKIIKEKNNEIYKQLNKNLNQKELILPTLMLIKNEKIEEIYQNKEFNKKELTEKYERILIKYTLCTAECN